MITVIVVVCLVVLLSVAITCFVFGWKTGRAQIEREFAEEAMRKEADKKYYENEKAKINTPDASVGVLNPLTAVIGHKKAPNLLKNINRYLLN